MSFVVDILTPSKVIAQNLNAAELLVPTVRGQINILEDHTHIVSKLDTGVLTLVSNGVQDNYLITTGICKVLKDKIVILANVCEHSKEIDRERAQAALDQAEGKLSGDETLSEEEVIKYRRKRDRAYVRLKLSVLGK
ncbi:MAG: ATP synthase F1 subunit epsilon [Bacteriovoracaceae bacterium]|jgi:F-type H+-transporting ATPase subunit epsilon|nr:ATP synthase F1 subunit epsilon [Bacteriovoracaceae bacterium]